MGITAEIKDVWEEWNLRGCIILSLSLQAILVFTGTYRRCFSNWLVLTLVWSSYLMADWIAAVSIGLISQSLGEQSSNKIGNNNNSNSDTNKSISLSKDLAAFWASFLLLHLGGPDSITSYSIEDNELWNRHLFGLILQVASAGYCFYLTIPDNKLWPPTLIISIVGIIKFAERTRALYLASQDRFGTTSLPKADPGPDYEEASTTYSSHLLNVPTQAEMITISEAGPEEETSYVDLEGTAEKSEITLLRQAYKLFNRFKGVIAGFYLTSTDRRLTRALFLKLDHKIATRLIENELSFMFKVLHTKAAVARTKIGCGLRLFCLVTTLVSFVYFVLIKKDGFAGFEIALTYALLAGALFLDIVSAVQLVLSDWTVLVLGDRWIRFLPKNALTKSKWSKQVSQYTLVNYCVDESPRWLYRFAGKVHSLGVFIIVKVMLNSSSKPVKTDLEKLVFDYVKDQAKEANTMQEGIEASMQRGDSALSKGEFSTYIKLKWSISEFQYTESLLLWHMATEICCHMNKKGSNEKRNCQILSDYLFYILIKKPAMMSPVLGNWHVVFQDTCAEANRFFDKYSVTTRKKALDELVNVKAKFRPAAVKGLKSKSVFFDSCILAHQLHRLNEEERWALMDRIWVEFMCFAAVNCQPIVHAQQPSRGGELLTFTWLMMTHCGLGLQYSEQEEQAGTRMVAVK